MSMLSRRLAILAGIVVVAGFAAASNSLARTIYDGAWAVELTGRTEGCMGTARYTLTISNGRISYGGGDASVSGRVSPNGMVAVRIITSSGQSGVGSGRLSRSYGSGTFRGHSSSGLCAGSWSGQRVG
jgi:hypothetical protein